MKARLAAMEKEQTALRGGGEEVRKRVQNWQLALSFFFFSTLHHASHSPHSPSIARRRRPRHRRPRRRSRRPRRRGRPLHLRGRRRLRGLPRGCAGPLQRVRRRQQGDHSHRPGRGGQRVRVRRVRGAVRCGERPAAGRDGPEGAGAEGAAQADERAGVEGAGGRGREGRGGPLWWGGAGGAVWRGAGGAGGAGGKGAGAGAGGVRVALLRRGGATG